MHVYVGLSCIAVHLKLPQHYYLLWKWKTLCDPMNYSVHGILQARILEWVAFPFSRGSSNPRIEPRSPVLQADSLPAEPQGKPIICYTPIQNKKFKVLEGEKVSGNFDAAESDTMKRKWGHDHLTNVLHFFPTLLHRTRWWVSSVGPPLTVLPRGDRDWQDANHVCVHVLSTGPIPSACWICRPSYCVRAHLFGGTDLFPPSVEFRNS